MYNLGITIIKGCVWLSRLSLLSCRWRCVHYSSAASPLDKTTAHQTMEINNDDNDADANTSTSQEPEEPSFCTFAATGPHTALQAIFVCQSCCSKQNDYENEELGNTSAAFCICQACAETCHAGHDDLEYMGIGPCYCDCGKSTNNASSCKCQLADISQEAATNLDLPAGGVRSHVAAVASDNDFVQEVFQMSALDDANACRRLVEQATELVKHTRGTHWVSSRVGDIEDDSSSCELEQLAGSIFRQHCNNYNLSTSDKGDESFVVGAEWWVQVKPTSVPEDDSSTRLLDSNTTNGTEAVDFHYDKDEDLAETFGLGYFPTLSTVTYLTSLQSVSPTVVFRRTYDQVEDDPIDEMLISHPRRGKHLVFDGRLLHGAPAHHALRPLNPIAETENQQDDVTAHDVRVTFLVNLWLSGRPSGVKPLSVKIRNHVKAAAERSSGGAVGVSLTASISLQPMRDITFERRCVEYIDLICEEQLPPTIRGRIELPFVSKGATWVDDDDEEGSGLILVTFPPPEHESDTCRVRFGGGLQAYLDYESYQGEEDDEGEAECIQEPTESKEGFYI